MTLRPSTTPVLVAATVTIWGLTWVAMRGGLHSFTCFSPSGLAAARMELGALALILVGLALRSRPPVRRDLLRLAAAGLIGFWAYGLLTFYGQRTVGAGTAAVIIQTAPVWTTIGAWLCWKEAVRPRIWVGMAASLIGLGLIAWGERAPSGPLLSWDVLLLVAASLAFAAYNLIVRPVAQRIGALPATGWAVIFGALGFLPWLPTAAHETIASGPSGWALIAFLAFGGLLAGYAAWAAMLSRMPAATASAFLYLVPVVAMAGGWLILHEVPTPASLTGAGIILAGVIYAQTR